MVAKETYDNLLAYQEILTEKFKLEEQIEDLPKIISSKMEVLNRVKRSYLVKHKQFKDLESNLTSCEKRLVELKVEYQDNEEKLKQVKSQREYEAIDKTLKSNTERQDEINLQIMQDKRMIDDLRSAIDDFELNIKQQEEDIVKEQDRVNAELVKFKKELDELKGKESSVIDGLDDEFRLKFEKIVKNKDGKGIVAVTRGFCSGCFLVLPTEYVNRVRKNDDIYFCPNCSRALYYDESPESIFTLEEQGLDDSEFFDEEV